MSDHYSKTLVCVVGATGNQGGSVARRFLQDDRFAVRGLTRDTSSPAARELTSFGAEMVRADLDDVETLASAFAGANVIFSVTQYWEPFFRPDCRARAEELGITCRRYAYDVEYRQGKNIADAAARTVDTLCENGFLVSTLSHAGKCSGGAIKDLYHFDAKADIFPDYVLDMYPGLAAKMSCIQTGYFTTSYRILPESYFNKQPDGTFEMRFPTHPDKPIPQLAVNEDMGHFVYAVHQLPPGEHYMAMGSNISWKAWTRLWGQVTGATITYKEVTFEDMVADTVDKDFGIEVSLMYTYASDPGYDGGMKLLTAEDIRKAGIDCPMTSVEEWMAKQDWSPILTK